MFKIRIETKTKYSQNLRLTLNETHHSLHRRSLHRRSHRRHSHGWRTLPKRTMQRREKPE